MFKKIRNTIWYRLRFIAGPFYVRCLSKIPVHTVRPFGILRYRDYTTDYCPVCQSIKVIYSKGLTACPDCGQVLYPCRACEDCDYDDCIYGLGSSVKPIANNPPVSVREIQWWTALDQKKTERFDKKTRRRAARYAKKYPDEDLLPF